jgi:TRAP-type C4-dicarboxylate transport system permease small subunit
MEYVIFGSLCCAAVSGLIFWGAWTTWEALKDFQW